MGGNEVGELLGARSVHGIHMTDRPERQERVVVTVRHRIVSRHSADQGRRPLEGAHQLTLHGRAPRRMPPAAAHGSAEPAIPATPARHKRCPALHADQQPGRSSQIPRRMRSDAYSGPTGRGPDRKGLWCRHGPPAHAERRKRIQPLVVVLLPLARSPVHPGVITRRGTRRSSTSRKLRLKRKYSQTAWAMTSAGNR